MCTSKKLIKPIALVGMMGVGKTSIGRILAKRLNVSFFDSDQEVEKAATLSVTDIYELYGEEVFKDTEKRVLKRLLSEEAPHVLSTGVETFIDPENQALLKEKTFSIWIKASLETVYSRVARRDHRPQLKGADKQKVLEKYIENFYPIYAKADFSINSEDCSTEELLDRIIFELDERYLE